MFTTKKSAKFKKDLSYEKIVCTYEKSVGKSIAWGKTILKNDQETCGQSPTLIPVPN